MAVNLSPYGGVGAQFLDNAGNVLTGGKIFTYAAGTTTPQVTYTTNAGNIPHPNPIILDAAGRVATGEIWLTDGLVYKFILRDANDVLIATYDNITGINSNFVAFTNQQEIQTATAGQTVFNLANVQYQPGTNSLSVFVDGVNQYGPGAQYAYLETDSDTVTFVNGLHVGAEVKFTTSQLNTSGSTNTAGQISFTGFKNQAGTVQDLANDDGSDWIGFEPAGVSAVARSAQDKMRDTVSVKDFGAVGDGVTDDTAAIQNAVNALTNNSCLIFPAGVYKVTAKVLKANLTNVSVIGYGAEYFNHTAPSDLEFTNCSGISVEGLKFNGNGGSHSPLTFLNSENVKVYNCLFRNTGSAFGYGMVHNTTSGAVGTKRSGLLVEGCVFEDIFRDGLQTKSVDDVVITNCVFRNCGGAGTDHHAFSVGVATGARLQISNCTFMNCDSGVFTGNERYSITGNTFENCVTAVYFDSADGIVSSNNVKSCQYGVRTITAALQPISGLLVADNILDTSVKHIELFGSTGPIYATIKNNVFGSGNNQVHVRRDGGIVRLQNNTWVGNVIFFTDDGPTACTKEIDESIYVTLADATVSGNLTQFVSQANFGGMFISIEDVTGFNSAYQGKAGYSDVAPPGTIYSLSYSGANIIFRNFQPTTLSATNVQIGPNANGQFRVRNDSGATKRFKITFES